MERVLVVEDDVTVQSLLAEALPRLGYDPVIAVNGKEGLETFRSQVFTIIITDIRMPEMDGLTMLKAIRKEDPHVPIIVITGYPSVDSAVESLVEGADYYLVKPINMIDLEAKLKKSFEKRKVQRTLASVKVFNIILSISIPLWILLGFFLAKLVN